MINLKNDIQTVKVSSDVTSYSTFLYSEPKLGKSTFAHKLFGREALFLMTENRERGLVGADVLKIKTWTDYTSAMKQLKRDKDLHDKYKVIVIDTVDNLYRFATDYAVSHFGIEELGDASFGKDYAYLDKVWQKGLEKVHEAGFTPIFIGHSTHKTVRVEADEKAAKSLEGIAEEVTEKGTHYLEYTKAFPDLKDKAFTPLNKMVDQILYLDYLMDEEGNTSRVIHLRDTPHHKAGSTFPDIQPVVPLDAESYKKALNDAVNHFDKSDQTDEDYNQVKPEVDFKAIINEAKELGMEFAKAGRKSELTDIISKYLGETKLNEAKASQFQQVQEITEELKELKNA